MRKLAIRITWDGQKQPAVWCPLGDFFGTAPGVNEYKSLLMGMTDDGFYSYWYMPFEKSALVELENDGDRERSVQFEITSVPLSRPFAGLGYFHCEMAPRHGRAAPRSLARLAIARHPGTRAVLRRDAARLESARRLVGRRG